MAQLGDPPMISCRGGAGAVGRGWWERFVFSRGACLRRMKWSIFFQRGGGGRWRWRCGWCWWWMCGGWWWVVVRRLGGCVFWFFWFLGVLVLAMVRCAARPSPLPSPPPSSFFAGHCRIEALALLNNVFPRSQRKHRKHPQTPHHTAPHRTARAVDVDINFVECPASSSSLLLLLLLLRAPSSGLVVFLFGVSRGCTNFCRATLSPTPHPEQPHIATSLPCDSQPSSITPTTPNVPNQHNQHKPTVHHMVRTNGGQACGECARGWQTSARVCPTRQCRVG